MDDFDSLRPSGSVLASTNMSAAGEGSSAALALADILSGFDAEPDRFADIPAAESGPALWSAILERLPGGAIIAGGAVRDHFMGVVPKDIDVFLPVERWPACGLGSGFQSLGVDRNEEYAAMPAIQVVQRGNIAGFQIDVVGLWFTDADYSAERIVSTFDFGISRCWFDGEVHDTPEAAADRAAMTVTRLLHDRPERGEIRFARLNERWGGRLAYIIAPAAPDASPVAVTEGLQARSGEAGGASQ